MRRAGLHRDADVGARQIQTTFGHDSPFRHKAIESLTRQDHHVRFLTAVEAIQQRQRRREIGIDPDRILRFVLSGKGANGALQRER